MAEAFFSKLAKKGDMVISSGTRPGEEVNPVVVEAMSEAGFDIADNKPKMLTLEMMDGADRVITMGCNVEEACPASFMITEDWELDDPAGKPIEEVRKIRDEIKQRVETLVAELEKD